ncbi:MAG: hypothetical protein WBM84_14325, partial [Sedimenticolaceae bacterium]
ALDAGSDPADEAAHPTRRLLGVSHVSVSGMSASMIEGFSTGRAGALARLLVIQCLFRDTLVQPDGARVEGLVGGSPVHVGFDRFGVLQHLLEKADIEVVQLFSPRSTFALMSSARGSLHCSKRSISASTTPSSFCFDSSVIVFSQWAG